MTQPRQAGLWVGLVAVTVFIAHLPSFFHRLLDGDEAIYGSIAALLNTGGQLYGPGGVDNKPPGIFWVYAGTFRLAGMYQMTAIHAVGFTVIAATCVLLFVIGRDMGGFRTGILAALFYGVLTAAGNPRLLATNTEIFMELALTASVLLMLRGRWFWSGCLLVAAGAFRQVAAVNVLLAIAGIVWLVPQGSRWRAAGAFAGGVMTTLAAGAAVLLLTGSLSGFWRWTVGSLYGYASTNWIPSYVWLRASPPSWWTWLCSGSQRSRSPRAGAGSIDWRSSSSSGLQCRWSGRWRPVTFRGTTSSRRWARSL
jgi:hypothetical protein